MTLPIAGGSLLLAGDAGAGTTIYPGNPPNAVYALDSDGTAVYFLSPGATNEDLFSVQLGGTGSATALTHNLGSGAVQIVLDGTNIYALRNTSVVRFPKAGGVTPVILGSVAGGAETRIWRRRLATPTLWWSMRRSCTGYVRGTGKF